MYDEVFNNLLLPTEARWLSKGHCLGRFFKLYDTVLEFMDESDADLSRKLKESKHSHDYLTDIFG